ncbi:MAG: energy-coupling factor transporter ATPase [Clostridia bacterium]|nr:energy-coupling factor transporter ATPase [Clostridia bacterium]
MENSTANNVVIKIDNVSYDYRSSSDEFIARGVKNVSLSIGKGEFCVLLGRNGSGKSTLAKLLNGFIVPDSGTITVNGIDTSVDESIYEIRSKVGMVFQNPDNQMVASIIEDDLAFGPENLGIPRDEIEKRITWALETVGMSEHRKRSPNKLSGGQKQRVAIASVLSMLPEILILDESTAMLDPKGRAEVMETAMRLNKEKGMTVILITHYMDEAVGADKVFVLSEGELIGEGTPREIFSNVELVKRAYLELPVASKISLELKESGYDIPFALTDEELAEGICKLK